MANQMAGRTKFYAILMDDFELIHLNTLLRRIEAHPLKMWVIVRATARVRPYKDDGELLGNERIFVGADPCGRPACRGFSMCKQLTSAHTLRARAFQESL